MPIDKAFKQNIYKALNDANLRGALGKFGDVFPAARAAVYEGIDFEELRGQISHLKSSAASKAEELAKQFEMNIVKRGGHVYRASDGSDVVDILTGIANKRGAKVCVKAKSMATEEIHLNEQMKDVLEMVETDLGEWIIQQVGEKPSHMVMPAIHLSKERCAEIFSGALGKRVEPDISLMVKLARQTLRDKFLNSDIGITGCNIAVAETGTIVLFTNEGNGRLTTTLPPVHVAILGYEKLVPNFKDIGPIAKALPKSATAQPLTSYVTMVTGPGPTLENGIGPNIVDKELHVIILDNGRKALLQDPVFKEITQCIRCASCLNVCPTYQLVGGHVYGHIYAGGIGVLLTSFFNSLQDADKPQEMCIGCGRCKEYCPAKINIPGLILEMRSRIRKQIPLPFIQRFIVDTVLKNKGLFHFGLRQASWAQKPFVEEGKDKNKFIRNLPFGYSSLANWRSLPALAPRPFRDIVKSMEQRVENKKGRVAFFGGCVIDFVYPEIAEALVRVLNKKGYEVDYPQEQTCCGAPAKYMGRQETAAEIAKQNLTAFSKSEYSYIVSACPTCTVALKHDWPHYVKGDEKAEATAKDIASKSMDFIKLVHLLASQGDGESAEDTAAACDAACVSPIQVTYHDSCHLNRELGVREEPREVLRGLSHLEFGEMEEADRCCGFGGSYCIKLPEVSAELLARKLRNVEKSGAQLVVVDCPGCMMSLRGGLDTNKSNTRVLHTAQVLDGSY
ncbi:MAG: L-lactate dehydrogenase (quinone) large subunit LdhH [Bacillota bacterium]